MPKSKNNSTKKTVKQGKDIVASMAEGFRKKLLKLIEDGIKELTIDIKKVRMIDSVGLGVLIASHNSMKKKGGKLAVINASEDIYKLFKTMRLEQHFEVKKVE